MKKTIGVLLAISLAVNVWFLIHASGPADNINAEATRSDSSSNAELTAVDHARDATQSGALLRALARIDQDDPASLVKNLRGSGADDETVRAVLDGALRRKYRVAVSAWRVERFWSAWWKGAASGTAGMPAQRSFVAEPEKKLLGTDPLDLADAAVRYDFLPPEKRRLLAMIDLDYGELQKPGGGGVFSRAATKAEATEEQFLVQERRKDILAALTPEERSEYDLRFTRTAEQNADRLAKLNVSEAEFRTLKPLLDAHQEAFRAAMAQYKYGPEAIAVEQRTVDQIVAALGYDRALEYFWGVSGPYDNVVSLMRGLNQPVSNAARLFQLAAQTGERATTIHYDASLTPDQKKAALLALQNTVRPHLDALVPPSSQTKLPEPAIGWFQMMSDGRYEQVRPTLYGSSRISVPPVSVSTPVTGSPRLELIVRPPRH